MILEKNGKVRGKIEKTNAYEKTCDRKPGRDKTSLAFRKKARKAKKDIQWGKRAPQRGGGGDQLLSYSYLKRKKR